MLYLKISLLFLIPLNVQSSYRRPREEYKRPKPFTMPDNIDTFLASQLKVPNELFCKRMALQGAEFYMVMPWWYHYCEGMKERNSKHHIKDRQLKPYKRVLNRVHEYKSRQKLLDEMSDYLRPSKLL